MKKRTEQKLLPAAAAVLGLLGLALRKWLYIAGPDGRKLLPLWHPLEIALWAVTAAVILLVVLSVRKLETFRDSARNYPDSMLPALGCIVMALGLGTTVALWWKNGGASPADLVLGAVSAAAMAFAAVCRIQRKRHSWAFHGLVCLFFALHLISRYRAWSGNPQIQDYVFTMLACVAMMLFAYQQAAFDAGCGHRRSQLRTGLLAGYFCLVALSATEDLVLYASGAVWSFTNLCTTVAGDREVA